MMKRGLPLLIVLLLLAGGFLAYTGSAQPVRRQVLKELRVENAGGCQRIITELQFPLAVQGHFPPDHGALLTVRVMPFENDRVALSDLVAREALLPARSIETALQQMSWEGDAAAGPQIVFQFAHDVAYDVAAGHDFRSLIVTIHPVTNDPAPCSDGAPVASGAAQ